MRLMLPLKNARKLALWCLVSFFAFNLGYMVAFYRLQININGVHKMDPSHRVHPELLEGFHALKHQKSFLTIAILSATRNFERRETIRETWLKMTRQTREKIIPLFVLGIEGISPSDEDRVMNENQKYKDILALQIQDSYSGLTKKLLKALVQIDQNVDFKYLLKVDDDSFVRVPEMIEELNNSNYQNKLYWGYFDGRAPIFRKDSSKYVEKNYVICDKYIPYALGGGYVLSQDLVHYIAENEQDLEIFSNEDVSIGTWVAPLKVNRVHDVRFDTEFKSRGCNNKHLVSHKQSVEEMRSKSFSILKNNVLCEREVTHFQHYIYNWDVAPSKCCQREPTN